MSLRQAEDLLQLVAAADASSREAARARPGLWAFFQAADHARG
jgi:hypothetical protein